MSEELPPCPFCGEPAYKTKAPDIAKYTVCSNSRCFLYKSDWIPKSLWKKRPIEDQLKSENDKLRAENERLREGLTNILLTDVVEFVHAHYRGEYPVEFAVWNLQNIAQQALNEVTK